MAIPLLAAVLLLSIGASVSIVSRKFHQVNATTWVKYYFQMIENMSLGLSVGIVQSGYRSPKIAANGSRLCAVWEIEKQNLNYAEKFI